MRIIFTILLLYNSLAALSQNKNIDSLKTALLSAKDSSKSELLDKLAWELKYSAPDEALSYSSWLYYYADTIGVEKWKALSLHKAGIILWVKGDLPEAIDTTKAAIVLFEKLGMTKRKAGCINNIAAIYNSMGNYEEGLKNYQLSLKLKEELGDSSGMVSTFTNLGNVRQYNGEYDEAVKQYMKAFDFAVKIKGIEPYKIGDIYNNLGVVYRLKNMHDSSVFYYKKALNIFEKNELKMPYAKALSNIGTAFFKINQHDSAMYYYKKAEPILKELDAKIHLARNITNIAEVFRVRRRFHEALAYAKQAEEILKHSSALKEQKTLLHFYADFYKDNSDYKKAFEYIEQYIVLNDSLLNIEKSKEIERLNALYQFEKKEKEITKLSSEKQIAQKERNIQQLHKNIALSGILVAIIVIAFIIYRLYTRKKLYEHKEALITAKGIETRLQLQNERLEKKHIIAEQKLKEEELKAQAEISRLQTERLNEKLEHKNRELTSNSLFMAQKNEALDIINDKIEEMTKNASNDNKKILRDVKFIIKENINLEEDWKNFRIHFEEVHPRFFKSLSEDYPELTQNDHKLCAYMKVNLSSKEIARLMNITPKSVQVSRYRIKKKFNLSQDDDLFAFIESL